MSIFNDKSGAVYLFPSFFLPILQSRPYNVSYEKYSLLIDSRSPDALFQFICAGEV